MPTSGEESSGPRGPGFNSLKQAQVVVSSLLVFLVVVGSLVLDQRKAMGNRILMPILSVMLTSANETVHSVFLPRHSKKGGSVARLAAMSVSGGTVAFLFAATCFGVPIRRFLDTINFGFFLSTLVTMPGACLLTEDFEQWKRSYLTLKPQTTVERICSTLLCSSLLGSWLGAWVIPLDWNCSWQAWPIPCFAGGVLGNLVGSMVLVRWLGRCQSKLDEKEKKRKKYELESKKKKQGEVPVCNETNWWMFM
ncbi:GPI biosynthesis protein family Pig-F [Chloropicon primus]|uniref:Phosphatidylinositol-glycan biosynthesis class F protein n=1 Tax=Chloropicon primus TaxID=1764295 RepID=A0A5B8MNS7_9CHLO|nr:hypothetical protein A3770_07p47010 [Chloropicon primus]UPR01400.1 GPI biosynthesis protein family Pig-F [Chloropicon primus]|eukprot:QDZ22183.1 hypothetical protein A3770_07p47010 [Chloropicon primus]